MQQSTIGKLFTNRNLILSLGVLAGLLLGEDVAFLKNYTVYILGAILAISVSSFRFSDLLPLRKSLIPVGVTVLVNYIIYGAVLLTLATLFVNNHAFWIGFVVIAATPPAIAVIPFSINLKGDARFSIIGIFGGNVAGIFLAPLIMLLFVGGDAISPVAVLELILKVLAGPIIISRLLRFKPVYGFIEKRRSVLIDYGFLIVAMTVIGVSREMLFTHTLEALIPFTIILFMLFGMGYLFQIILNALHIDPHLIISNKLILVMKNAGFASVVALNLFSNDQVVLPAAILSVMLPIYYIVQSNINLFGTLKKQHDRRLAFRSVD